MYEELPMSWRHALSSGFSLVWRGFFVFVAVLLVVDIAFHQILQLVSEKVAALPVLFYLEMMGVLILSGALLFKWMLSKEFKKGIRWVFTPRDLSGGALEKYLAQQKKISLEKAFKAWYSLFWRVSCFLLVILTLVGAIMGLTVIGVAGADNAYLLAKIAPMSLSHPLLTSQRNESLSLTSPFIKLFEVVLSFFIFSYTLKKTLNKNMGEYRLSVIIPVKTEKKIVMDGIDVTAKNDEKFTLQS